MPPVGFVPTILAGERPKTNALDRAATGTRILSIYILIFLLNIVTNNNINNNNNNYYYLKCSRHYNINRVRVEYEHKSNTINNRGN